MTKTLPAKHIRVLSLGAGVQSSTLYLMGVEGELHFEIALFADTGEEPASVYEHLAYLETLGGPEIIRVSEGHKLGDDILSSRRHPSNKLFFDIPVFFGDGTITRRYCTKAYKIIPIQREIRTRIGRSRSSTATQLLGISTDEWHRIKPSRAKWITNEYPLIDRNMSRQDCLKYWHDRIPNRPLPKSACTFCPFHAPRQWLNLYRLGGKDWDRVVEIDNHVGAAGQRLHRSGRPITEVAQELDYRERLQPTLPGIDAGGWGDECAGVCGV